MRLDEISQSLEEMIPIHCAKAVNARPLYRGTLTPHEGAFLGKIRKNRTPLSSDELRVAIFNLICKLNKWPHRKANTLSLSTDWKQARFFGGNKYYRCFPFDDAQYLYSNVYEDFLNIADDILSRYARDTDDRSSSAALNKYFKDGDTEVIKYIKLNIRDITHMSGLKYTQDINELRTNGEVLVFGTKYIAVPQLTEPSIEEIRKWKMISKS